MVEVTDTATPRSGQPDAGGPMMGRYQLSDRYTRDVGRVFLSGVQALARLPLEQMRVDRLNGLRTAAFVSGYPGSPLAGFDKEAGAASTLAGDLPYVHTPGLNEELAATAVMGSQIAAERRDCRYDGITGYWYGKTPGVDRAGDSLRHALFAGVHRNSGAVALVGDDGAAKSSTLPSSCDATLIGLNMPIITPGDVQEALDLGRHAIAMSRASGLWTALKIVAAVADGTGTVHLGLDRVQPVIPRFEVNGRPFVPRADGGLITPHTLELEKELFEVRLELARRYGADNRLNEVTVDPPDAWIGLAACGHTYQEMRQALRMLGLRTDAEIAAAGIRVLRLRMRSPIDGDLLRRFGSGLSEILVVEDKNPALELLLKDALYSSPDRPLIAGKYDEEGRPLLAPHGALDADAIVGPLRSRLARRLTDDRLAPLRTALPPKRLIPLSLNRTPYFCSGCPHNTGSRVPEGALVGGGIGCHAMVAMMEPERVGEIVGLTCMGNEGAQWVGMAPFLAAKHLFQNLGDGTYAHSGQLAVRWAVASGVDITYKILVNGVVAMTGGQDAQGAADVPTMARILLLQGVQRVIITTENLDRYRSVTLPERAEAWDRSRIVEAQEVLAATPGTTVLIHDQYCAAENRRLRKRKQIPTPPFRVLINERICEGCGDCGQKSNCLSVQPVDTEFGRKTRIDQSSCNLDFSCLNGDCPSFATITPATSRFSRVRWRFAGKAADRGISDVTAKPRRQSPVPPMTLAEPTVIVATDEFVLRMSGIGGTGVVTVSQIIGTAAMLEGYHVRGLDQTGLSQKAGPVVSDLCLSQHHDQHGSNKAGTGEADLMLAFDLLGAASDAQLKGASPDRTIVIGSVSATPTGLMVLHPGVAYPERTEMEQRLDAASRQDLNHYAPVNELVTGLFGDNASANVFLAGVALQAGALPISAENLERAIELNGVAVERNIAAFRWGRQWIIDPSSVAAAAGVVARQPEALDDDPIGLRARDLVFYQSAAYSRRYLDVIDDIRSAGAAPQLIGAVARNLYKLMAYKDEYEVARLLLSPEARAAAETVGGKGAKVTWQLNPPLLRAIGIKNKIKLGRWATPVMIGLRAGRRLRGTPLDIVGYTSMRRTERRLAADYADMMKRLVRAGADDGVVLQIAELPDMIRGYESIKERNIEAYRTRLAELLTLVA